MSEDRYSLAGWLSLAQAVIFPLAFVVSIIQGIIGAELFHYRGPVMGPSDLLFVLFTAIGVYVLIMLRTLLNERYNYHDIDVLITFAIWWTVLFQVGTLFLRTVVMIAWPVDRVALVVGYIFFMGVSMVAAGIIDILIAVRLLKIKDSLSDLFKAYIYIIMISGILEITIILSPLSLLLLPVGCAMLGIIFLREKEEVEFV